MSRKSISTKPRLYQAMMNVMPMMGVVSSGILAFSLGHSSVAKAAEDSMDYIHWQAAYTGEAAANVKGGEQRGSAYAGQLFLGADFDMEEPGAKLHW